MTRFTSMLLGSAVASITMGIGIALFKPGPPPADMSRWATIEEPTTRVRFAGIPPKELRVWSPEPGKKLDLRLRLAEVGKAEMARQSLFELDGEAVLLVRTKVESVNADGHIAWSWVVKKAEVTRNVVSGELPANAWSSAVSSLKGLRGSSLLDGQGYVLEYEWRGGGTGPDANLAIEVERILREPVPLLPDSAIGERAEWEVSRAVLNDGVPTRTTERWKAVSLSDKGWEFEVTATGRGDGGAADIDLPGFEGETGTAVTLEGGGAFTLEPGELLLEGEAWSSTQGGVDVGVPGMSGMGMTITTDGEVELRVER